MKVSYIVLFVIIIAAIIGLAVWVGSDSTISTSNSDDPNRPIAEAKEKEFDFGEMNAKDVKEHNFEIKNSGKNDLILSQVSTSCDCTYVYIINSAGEKSPKFTMHGISNWQIKIKSGEAATLQVIYEPAIMPVEGAVERFISIATNDPNNPKLEFNIKAKVNK